METEWIFAFNEKPLVSIYHHKWLTLLTVI